MKTLSPYITLFIFVLLLSCNNTKDNENVVSDDDIDISIDTIGNFEHSKKVKKIFYNIPSPLEMTSLMQKAGADFNPKILNKPENVDNYISVNKMALNLGVYGADLSYTRIFDQIQRSVTILSSIRKLSDGLGIPQDKGSFAINRLEENLNNRDSLLQIISDTYSSADLYLKENDRGSTAALIVTGGWVEGLYIAAHIVGDSANYNQEILTRIGEQKFSLNNLIELLKIYKDEDEDIKTCFPKILELKNVFDKINVEYTKGEVITDADKKMTIITSKADVQIETSDVEKIKKLIIKIRNYIINIK